MRERKQKHFDYLKQDRVLPPAVHQRASESGPDSPHFFQKVRITSGENDYSAKKSHVPTSLRSWDRPGRFSQLRMSVTIRDAHAHLLDKDLESSARSFSQLEFLSRTWMIR